MFLPVWCFFSPDVLCVHSEHLECQTEQFWLLASPLGSSKARWYADRGTDCVNHFPSNRHSQTGQDLRRCC